MKILFAHDHKFHKVNGEYYSNAFSYALWERYLGHFENLTVIGRLASEGPPHGTRMSSGPGVTFFEAKPELWTRFGFPSATRRRTYELVEEHDAVVARLPSELGLMAIAAARKLEKPFLVEVVGSVWDALWNHGGLGARAYAPLAHLRMKVAVSKAPFVLYVSEEFLQSQYPSASHAITTVASNVELPPASIAALSARLDRISRTRESVTVGLIGSLNTRYKGIHIALEALSNMAEQRWVFDILGPGDPSPYQRLAGEIGIADKVRFSGTLPSGPNVLEWLDKIDIYIQPSLQEGVPRALIEAMSRGCPALASSAGGIPELLDSECIVPAGSSTCLSELLARVLFDREWAMVQARKNFDKAKSYDKLVLAERRASILNKLARASKELGL